MADAYLRGFRSAEPRAQAIGLDLSSLCAISHDDSSRRPFVLASPDHQTIIGTGRDISPSEAIGSRNIPGDFPAGTKPNLLS